MFRSFLSQLGYGLQAQALPANAMELLEQRRMFATTMIYNLDFQTTEPPYILSGLTDSYSYTAGTGIAAYFEESPLPATFADAFTITRSMTCQRIR